MDTHFSETWLQVAYKTARYILVCVKSAWTMQPLFNVAAIYCRFMERQYTLQWTSIMRQRRDVPGPPPPRNFSSNHASAVRYLWKQGKARNVTCASLATSLGECGLWQNGGATVSGLSPRTGTLLSYGKLNRQNGRTRLRTGLGVAAGADCSSSTG